jgi:hypothetical protein
MLNSNFPHVLPTEMSFPEQKFFEKFFHVGFFHSLLYCVVAPNLTLFFVEKFLRVPKNVPIHSSLVLGLALGLVLGLALGLALGLTLGLA